MGEITDLPPNRLLFDRARNPEEFESKFTVLDRIVDSFTADDEKHAAQKTKIQDIDNSGQIWSHDVFFVVDRSGDYEIGIDDFTLPEGIRVADTPLVHKFYTEYYFSHPKIFSDLDKTLTLIRETIVPSRYRFSSQSIRKTANEKQSPQNPDETEQKGLQTLVRKFLKSRETGPSLAKDLPELSQPEVAREFVFEFVRMALDPSAGLDNDSVLDILKICLVDCCQVFRLEDDQLIEEVFSWIDDFCLGPYPVYQRLKALGILGDLAYKMDFVYRGWATDLKIMVSLEMIEDPSLDFAVKLYILGYSFISNPEIKSLLDQVLSDEVYYARVGYTNYGVANEDLRKSGVSSNRAVPVYCMMNLAQKVYEAEDKKLAARIYYLVAMDPTIDYFRFRSESVDALVKLGHDQEAIEACYALRDEFPNSSARYSEYLLMLGEESEDFLVDVYNQGTSLDYVQDIQDSFGRDEVHDYFERLASGSHVFVTNEDGKRQGMDSAEVAEMWLEFSDGEDDDRVVDWMTSIVDSERSYPERVLERVSSLAEDLGESDLSEELLVEAEAVRQRRREMEEEM